MCINIGIAPHPCCAELIFVGMRPAPDVDAGKLEKETSAVRIKRKKVQEEKRIAYEKALISLKDVVREEWGPEYREQEMDKRRNWFTTKLQVKRVIND